MSGRDDQKTAPELHAGPGELNQQQKKKKNQHRAKEFPIETQVATSMKGVQVKSTHKLGSGDYPVGY